MKLSIYVYSFLFMIAVRAALIRLSRFVSMYQWFLFALCLLKGPEPFSVVFIFCYTTTYAIQQEAPPG